MTIATGSTIPADLPPAAGARAALALRAQAGDGRAFAQLVEAEYGFIFATAFKWCGSRADAEDAAQEVCLKLAEAIRSFDGRSSFSTWLYRVTLNAVRDQQRMRARAVRNARALAEIVAGDEPAEQESAVALADLWRAVRSLPEKQRDAVLLVYAEGLSHADAAAILECREVTVSWHVHEARKTLRGLL